MPMTSDIPHVAASAAPSGGGDLSALRALILLGGSIRPTDLSRGIERSPLDLPIDDRHTILTQWARAADSLCHLTGATSLAARVVLNHQAAAPKGVPHGVSVEREPAEFRGSGGLLRDLSSQFAPDDLILVANAAQVLLEPLAPAVAELATVIGDVRILAHADGTPASVMLIRAGVLGTLGAVGYMDLKEQALPKLAASGAVVRVAMRARAIGMPVRTGESYIGALHALHCIRAGRPLAADPLEENWASTFTIAEADTRVDPTARVQDSVLLAGARVGPGAVVVRSVVGPRGVVAARDAVLDAVLNTDSQTHNRAGAR